MTRDCVVDTLYAVSPPARASLSDRFENRRDGVTQLC